MMNVTRTVDAPPAPAVREPVVVPAAAVVEPAPAPPLTLLAQAEEALRQALVADREARRAVEDPRSPVTWDDVARCAQVRRHAEGELDRLHQAVDNLRRDLPALQHTVVAAEGQLAQVEETARRQLLNARRQAAQAREAYTTVVHQVAAIAGPGAVPAETAG